MCKENLSMITTTQVFTSDIEREIKQVDARRRKILNLRKHVN